MFFFCHSFDVVKNEHSNHSGNIVSLRDSFMVFSFQMRARSAALDSDTQIENEQKEMRKRQSNIEQCFTCETFFVKSHLRQCVCVSKRERDEMSVLGASKLNSNALFFWFVFGFHFRFFRRKTRASHIRSLFFWSTFHLHLSRYIMHFKSDSDVDARTIRSTLVLFELRLILPFFPLSRGKEKGWIWFRRLVGNAEACFITVSSAHCICICFGSLFTDFVFGYHDFGMTMRNIVCLYKMYKHALSIFAV